MKAMKCFAMVVSVVNSVMYTLNPVDMSNVVSFAVNGLLICQMIAYSAIPLQLQQNTN